MDPWGAAELTVVKFCRHASGGSPDPSELARPTFRFPAFALIRTDGGPPIGLARGQGRCLAHPTLKAIAGRHGHTAAQALLRWHIESGFVAIPKSATPARIAENIDVFGFELTKGDRIAIASLDRADGRTGPDPLTLWSNAYAARPYRTTWLRCRKAG